MNKKILVLTLAITAGSILQAHQYYDENGYMRRDGLGALFAAPFDIAGAPFDKGNYVDREYNPDYDTRLNSSDRKNRNRRQARREQSKQESRSKRSRDE